MSCTCVYLSVCARPSFHPRAWARASVQGAGQRGQQCAKYSPTCATLSMTTRVMFQSLLPCKPCVHVQTVRAMGWIESSGSPGTGWKA